MANAKPFLSIVIPCRNEPENLAGTIRTIEETAAGFPLEIIAINDGGPVPPFDAVALNQISARVRTWHNPTRQGHSACRQLGAAMSAGEWLLFTDAHMVFEPGWFEAFEIQTHTHSSKTLFCGPYIASNAQAEAERQFQSVPVYWGARLYYWERHGNALDVLAYKPLARPPEGLDKDWSFEVPCVIGANYFIRRDWFETIDGLKHFYGWTDQDEFMLSLKTWLFGGAVKLIPDVRLRHVLHPADGRGMARSELLFNKLSTAYQIFPSHVYEPFLTALPRGEDPKVWSAALQMVSAHREALEQAHSYFVRNIRRDHTWLCSKWNLMLPTDIGAAQFIAMGQPEQSVST